TLPRVFRCLSRPCPPPVHPLFRPAARRARAGAPRFEMTPQPPADDDLSQYFQPSYRASRERLLERAHRLSARHPVLVDSRAIAPRGPDGETLALDWVCFGARQPRHVLVLSSGTHGVEGYTGSAIQHHALATVLPRLRLEPGSAVVVQHANNPYGFAWPRPGRS